MLSDGGKQSMVMQDRHSKVLKLIKGIGGTVFITRDHYPFDRAYRLAEIEPATPLRRCRQ